MSTAAEFFSDIKNTRMCLLYEYLRGLSPDQAQIEMLRASGNVIDEKVITGWFARFYMNKFDVNLQSENTHINGDDPRAELSTNDKTKYDEAYEAIEAKFPFNKETEDLLDFLADIKKSKDEEGFKVTELEISVKNDAQPKHVLIAVQCATKTKAKEFLSVEIYHCSNGIVIRRGKRTKLLESALHYKYYEVARGAILKLLVELEKNGEIRVDTLKLSIDTDDKKTENSDEHHTDFFRKLMNELKMVKLSEPLGVTDLIKFHNKVKVSKELNIRYGKCDVNGESNLPRIIKWMEVFLRTFDVGSKAKCVIQTIENKESVNSAVRGLRIDARVTVEKDKIIITRKDRKSSGASTGNKPSPSPKTADNIPSTSQQSSSSAAP